MKATKYFRFLPFLLLFYSNFALADSGVSLRKTEEFTAHDVEVNEYGVKRSINDIHFTDNGYLISSGQLGTIKKWNLSSANITLSDSFSLKYAEVKNIAVGKRDMVAIVRKHEPGNKMGTQGRWIQQFDLKKLNGHDTFASASEDVALSSGEDRFIASYTVHSILDLPIAFLSFFVSDSLAPNRSGYEIVNIPEGEVTFRSNEEHYEGLDEIAISPDDRYLATGESNKVVLWDFRKGEYLRSFYHEAPGSSKEINDLEFSPEGDFLLTVGNDRTIKRIDVGKRKIIREYHPEDKRENSYLQYLEIEFLSDKWFVSTSDNGELVLWDYEQKHPIQERTVYELKEEDHSFNDDIVAMDVSVDNNKIAVGLINGRIKIFKVGIKID